MSQYDAIIIGAGNGGLTSAAALAKAGKKVLLLEKHNVPGGCATSFIRGRFEFEVALHQLSGMGSPENPGPLRRILSRLEVEDKIDWVEIENQYRAVIPGKIDITLPATKEGSIAVLQKEFPLEKENIQKFFDMIYKYMFEWFGSSQTSDAEVTRDKFPSYFKYNMRSAQEVLDELFHDENLKLVLSFYWSYMGVPPERLSFDALAMCIVGYLEFKAYHMKGGSQVMSTALTETIIKYGGDIRFNTGVEKIISRDGQVYGVVTAHGDEFTSDYIVSNISPVNTFVNMIEPQQLPPEVLYNMGNSQVGVSSFIMYIGLDCEPGEIGITESMNVFCNSADSNEGFKSTRKLGTEDDFFILSCYTLDDPHFSPPGTSQVVAVCLKYGDPWIELPPEKYYDTKYRSADTLLNRIEDQFSGFRSHIEEIEVATPLTCMRFLGHPGGAIYGFDKDIKDAGFFFDKQRYFKNLYFAGTWTEYDGFQPTLSSGYSTAKEIIKDSEKGGK